MTDTSVIDRDEWSRFFDVLTKDHEGDLVTLEVLSREWGDQHEVERLPFAYASYDPKDDAVIIGVGGSSSRYPVVFRHIIEHPAQVDLAAPAATETAVRIVDGEGTSTLLQLFGKPAPPEVVDA